MHIFIHIVDISNFLYLVWFSEVSRGYFLTYSLTALTTFNSSHPVSTIHSTYSTTHITSNLLLHLQVEATPHRITHGPYNYGVTPTYISKGYPPTYVTRR